MIEINLLPEEERKRKKEMAMPQLSLKVPGNMFVFGGIGLFLVLLIVLVIIHFSQAGTINRLNKKIDEKKVELRKLEEEKKQVENMKAKEASINQKLQTIDKLAKNRFSYAKFMDLVSERLPDYLWLEQVKISGNMLIIKGKTFSNLMITDFISKLENLTDFVDPASIVLKDMVNKPEEGHDIISFEINCKYKQ